ncbi:MAG TPA: GNAT family N-acetyltransferase [Pyrinomonadaceae bacterium]|jgi:GNAT superfamily N-acetyltransferase|nr:GNAT family N-acetyltransferase [Pyrinomonadaceae bacterium]
MAIVITNERPDSDLASELIAELEAHLTPLYPDESRHGYSVEKLLQEGVAFFVIHYNEQPAGCGGVQLFGSEYAEIKRMYVRPALRGLGLGKLMVNHLETYVRNHGIRVLRLETGVHQGEAIRLYERMGFKAIGPFGTYRDDPLSRFYEKEIWTPQINYT